MTRKAADHRIAARMVTQPGRHYCTRNRLDAAEERTDRGLQAAFVMTDAHERTGKMGACPRCSEDRIDYLVWDRDGINVTCTTCGHTYRL